jgi:hypothetical protein
MAHHLFGVPAAMDRIRALCRRTGRDPGRRRCTGDGARDIDGRSARHAGRRRHLQPRPRQEHHLRLRRHHRSPPPTPVAAAIARESMRGCRPPSHACSQLIDLHAGLPDGDLRPAVAVLDSGRNPVPRTRADRSSQSGFVLRRLSGHARRPASQLAHGGLPTRIGRGPRRDVVLHRVSSRCACRRQRHTHPLLRLPTRHGDAAEKSIGWSRSRQRGLGAEPSGIRRLINEIPEMRPAFEGQQFPAAQAVSRPRLVTLPTHHWLSDARQEGRSRRCAATCGGGMTASIAVLVPRRCWSCTPTSGYPSRCS